MTVGELVVDRVFPGGVAVASVGGAVVAREATGHHTYDPGATAVTDATVYDLASVTKVFVAVAALRLVQDGQLDLDDRVCTVLPSLGADKVALTVRHLLTHTGGLPSVPELHMRYPDRTSLTHASCAIPLRTPPGTEVHYTSIGYQYLGWLVEAVAATRLDEFVVEEILRPCGLRDTTFRPPQECRHRIAPTEWSDLRGRLVHGEVHDENSWILGGVTGHTGLFGTADDVRRFGEALLRPGLLEQYRTLLFADLTGGLQPGRSAALARNAPMFGDWQYDTWSHTGFTGTSLCLVPDLDLVAVLLSNRVYPSRTNEEIGRARRRLHAELQVTVDAL